MKKILFIEDEADLNKAYQLKFSNIYNVSFAVDGETGIKKAINWQPNLIVLDIILPGEINGIGVLKQLKENTKTSSIPVIVLTNLDNEEKTTIDLGAEECLVKAQTSFDKVTETIEKYL